jgi:hypothetical protein
MSGLSRTPGKRVWVYPHRGFESRLLRQRSGRKAPSGAFLLSSYQLTLQRHLFCSQSKWLVALIEHKLF